jgi:hypothetical protein
VAVSSGSAAVLKAETEFKETSPERLKELMTLNYDRAVNNVIHKLHGSTVSIRKREKKEGMSNSK